MSTVQVEAKAHDPEEEARQERIKRMPPLEQCYNLIDFEVLDSLQHCRHQRAYEADKILGAVCCEDSYEKECLGLLFLRSG